MSGRGRGNLDEEGTTRGRLEPPRAGASSEDGDRILRGRGGFRSVELNTIPSSVTNTRAISSPDCKPIQVMANYIGVSTMPEREVYQYTVDYEPNLESVPARKRLFREATTTLFNRKVIFNGRGDARSGICSPQVEMCFEMTHPFLENTTILIKLKRVGTITASSEMITLYNMHMKEFFRTLGFYQVSTNGAYVHPDHSTVLGRDRSLITVRGFRSSANMFKNDKILMNLESCHKLMQCKNVLQNMEAFRSLAMSRSMDLQAFIKSQLIGKLVVASYKKIVYRVEDVNFHLNPQDKFTLKKTNTEISYIEYFQTQYNTPISDKRQPLLLAVQNNKRQGMRDDGERGECYLVPELCNIAGLTDQQRNDNFLKRDLITSSQIAPGVRVEQLQAFLRLLHDSQQVREVLNNWGYNYDTDPLTIPARILKLEKIGAGRRSRDPHDTWPNVDGVSANFDRCILSNDQTPKIAVVPPLLKLATVIYGIDERTEKGIWTILRTGFGKVGLQPQNFHSIKLREGDQAHSYAHQLRNLPNDVTLAIVVLPRQMKDRYDAIKRYASVERGLLTQVVTHQLLKEERKAHGAAVKIAIQVAAKLGGEPWWVNIPTRTAMICGYDTYHDTSSRGRSYGAFVASMNSRFSRWYSKVDQHDKLDELSSHMAQNLSASLQRYQEINDCYPERVIIYRDGVGDGQIEHVVKIELNQIRQAIKEKDKHIRLTFVIVNKRIGARFYYKNNNQFINPPPGTVIDDVVTRKGRFDFYLISQSTRNGTVTPTYYNIIEDESGFSVANQQLLAFKLCFLYYNWTGTVRVPAPCQYAHKLAMLCGENLHNTPNVNLADKLHFL